jgi:CBS domain-containing protein
MRTRFPIVRAGDPLWVAYEKLRRSQLFAIPVVNRETDGLDGLVSLADIRRAIRDGSQPAPLR